MKNLNYTLSGSGVRMLRLFSTLFFIATIIVALALLYLGLNDQVSEYAGKSTNWVIICYAIASLFFGGFICGIGNCIAFIAENSAIRTALLKTELEEKEILVKEGTFNGFENNKD